MSIPTPGSTAPVHLRVTPHPCLRLDCPAWFERVDFRAALALPGTAAWRTLGEPPHDYTDAFLICDHGEGLEDLPQDIAAEIARRVEQAGLDHAVVWLSRYG